MRGGRAWPWLFALVGLWGAPSPVGASVYDLFGATARDVAMGSAMTAASEGYSGLFYNPAALTAGRRQQVGIGMSLTLPELYIDRARPDSAHPSTLPEPHTGLSLGWVKPLPGVLGEGVALGFSVYLPMTKLVRVEGLDPQTPQFYLFQNLHEKVLIHGGLALAPWGWLSLGASVQILADLRGGVTLDLDTASGTFKRREMKVALTPTAALFLGVQIHPTDGVTLGLSYRGSSSLFFELPVSVSEGETLAMEIGVSQTVLWTPHELSFGLAAVAARQKLTVALDATLAFWSQAPDPSPRLSVDMSGRLLDAFGLADALDLSTRSAPIALGFSDTLTARLGAEWEAAPWLRLRGGYFYRPTPAPSQTEATAYLDNDAHIFALGAGLLFGASEETAGAPLRLDLAAQLSVLPRRTVQRQLGDPVGDLSHGGLLWTLTTTLSHSY